MITSEPPEGSWKLAEEDDEEGEETASLWEDEEVESVEMVVEDKTTTAVVDDDDDDELPLVLVGDEPLCEPALWPVCKVLVVPDVPLPLPLAELPDSIPDENAKYDSAPATKSTTTTAATRRMELAVRVSSIPRCAEMVFKANSSLLLFLYFFLLVPLQNSLGADLRFGQKNRDKDYKHSGSNMERGPRERV